MSPSTFINTRHSAVALAALTAACLTAGARGEAPASPGTAGTAVARAEAAPAATDAAAPLSIDYSGDFWKRPALTGDWGGTRNELARKGVTVDMYLAQVYQGVITGGLDKGWNYSGHENISLNFDTQKMGLWPGGFLFVEGEGNYGEFVGARQTGALIPADMNQVTPGLDSPNFYMPAFQYTQFLCKEFGVFIGKLDTLVSGDMNEFAQGKGNEGFLNMAFCFNPVAGLTVPSSTLGVGMIFLPTGNPKELIITMNAVDSEGSASTSGFNTAFKGGTTFAAEGRYTTHFFNMTGHQLLGGTYSDRAFTDLDQNLRNLIIPGLITEKSSGSWCAYYNFDQYFYQPDPKVDRGVGVFGRIGGSDGVANPVHLFFSFGIGGKGPIKGRENDQFGIGWYYIQTANATIPQRLNVGDSQGLEAYYEFAITPWLHVTPDIQYIQPGQDNVTASTVLGVRLEMKF